MSAKQKQALYDAVASAKDGVKKAAKKFVENIKKSASDIHNNNGGFVNPHWNKVDDVVESGSNIIHNLDIDSLPQNVQKAYKKYDINGWAGNVPGQSSGTKAGGKWKNENGQLPIVNNNGEKITYREFDVNDKIPGQKRDTERFIVGSDGSIYYTDSHYGQGNSLNGIGDFVRIK